MPRQARIDAPGAIHHIICRGLERRKIFRDDTDRDDFVRRLGDILLKTGTPCFAWALIPNHFHLLLKTGQMPLSVVMSKLLTGYAVSFNHRHHRAGHVFQNRYKSILCQEESYLLELVRYIHLNPLRAGIVNSVEELTVYSYCGHSRLLTSTPEQWQCCREVLTRFSDSSDLARMRYAAFVADGISDGRRPEFSGGGLVRSAGGWHAVIAAHRVGTFLKSDERILGDSDFVEAVLASVDEHVDGAGMDVICGVTLDAVAQRVAELLNVNVGEVFATGKKATTLVARNLLCYWGLKHVGVSATALGKILGLSQPSVSRAAERGQRLSAEKGWELR